MNIVLTYISHFLRFCTILTFCRWYLHLAMVAAASLASASTTTSAPTETVTIYQTYRYQETKYVTVSVLSMVINATYSSRDAFHWSTRTANFWIPEDKSNPSSMYQSTTEAWTSIPNAPSRALWVDLTQPQLPTSRSSILPQAQMCRFPHKDVWSWMVWISFYLSS